MKRVMLAGIVLGSISCGGVSTDFVARTPGRFVVSADQVPGHPGVSIYTVEDTKTGQCALITRAPEAVSVIPWPCEGR
jgi:hypothetical protein